MRGVVSAAMMALVVFAAGGEAGAAHAFAQAAFFQEIPFEAAELLVEQVVGELDEADHDVGGDGGVGMLDAFPEGGVAGVGLAVEFAETAGVGMFSGPFGVWECSLGHSAIPRTRRKSR